MKEIKVFTPALFPDKAKNKNIIYFGTEPLYTLICITIEDMGYKIYIEEFKVMMIIPRNSHNFFLIQKIISNLEKHRNAVKEHPTPAETLNEKIYSERDLPDLYYIVFDMFLKNIEVKDFFNMIISYSVSLRRDEGKRHKLKTK